MPLKPKVFCPRCGTGHRGRCPKYDAQRGSARARGYDADWERVRAAHLQAHPWCSCGCGEPATDVDHIVPVRQAPHRRLDPSNLRSFAHACHTRRTMRDRWGSDPR